MRYFEKKSISVRYDKYRPQVHANVIQQFMALAASKDKFEHVADIACGTGHSTKPLFDYAQNVSATDISQEMLNIAKERCPQASYYLASAEKLPFKESSLDAVFVCMALHWFDQEKFILEVRRVLKSGGWLFIYNMSFPGVMVENTSYNHWHCEKYWTKFPNPKRHVASLQGQIENLDNVGLSGSHVMDLLVDFDSLELRNYLMTQSNIDQAFDCGYSVDSIETWIDEGVKPFFSDRKEKFIYACQLEYFRFT